MPVDSLIPFSEEDGIQLFHGDCLDVLPLLPENSIDAVITDPPYDLTANKKGGSGDASVNLDSPYGRSRVTTGFMSKTWDGTGIAFKPETWKAVMRVMKPGAHLLAFGGTRTYARMICAMEDAGLEVRDEIDFWYDANPVFAEFYNSLSDDQKALLHQSAGASHLSWEYGSGFPKSLDIQRAIDSELCELPGRHYWTEQSLPKGDKAKPDDHVCPFTEIGAQHEGKGTALKPAHEPIVLARKPIPQTVAQNILAHGTGGLNVDGCRIKTGDNLNGGAYSEDASDRHDGAQSWRFKNGGARQPMPGDEREGASLGMFQPGKTVDEAFTQPEGRWPANLVLSHSEGCELIGTKKSSSNGHYPAARGQGGLGTAGHAGQDDLDERFTKDEEIEDWRCVETCPVRVLNEQTGALPAGIAVQRNGGGQSIGGQTSGIYSGSHGLARPDIGFNDSGGAARFFYCAKASVEDREDGLEDLDAKQRDETRQEGNPGGDNPRNRGLALRKNSHPTVKATDLMRWLVRLITPPGGTVLDPFAGSGSTGKACALEGFKAILIERELEYCEIAKRRSRLRQKRLF